MTKKALVVYFSGGGVTARTAKALAEAAEADIYEIRPEVPYTKADLFWPNVKCRSIVEMRNKSYRPPLADRDADIASYDTIFLGFPIWCGIAPTIVNTFLESYDFSGKTIIPFATSGGSGYGSSSAELRKSVSPTCTVKEGKMLNGRPNVEKLRAWVEEVL